MLFTTIAVVLVASVGVELAALRTIPTRWPWMRWSVMPALGAFLAGALPVGLLPQAYWIDFWVGTFVGVSIASLVAMGAIFTYDFWSGPSAAELARTGRRSALQGIGLAASERKAKPHGPHKPHMPAASSRKIAAPQVSYRNVRPGAARGTVPKKRDLSARMDVPKAFQDGAPAPRSEKEPARAPLRQRP